MQLISRAKIALGLGSNLGNSCQTLQLAAQRLGELDKLTVIQMSSMYATKPIGPPQPDYINACLVAETVFSPFELLEQLQQLEQTFDRVRLERWGPRTLDLDVLLWEDQQINSAMLQVPHPRMAERGFVLAPLAEIAPNWRHPVLGQAIAELLKTVDCSGVRKLSDAELS